MMKTTCSLIDFIWIWDKIQGLKVPAHHKKMARFLMECYFNPTDKNGLLMAFRNSGKSTIIGLFCAWILWQNPNTRILILSADHDLAKKMVQHIKHIIEHHPLTGHLKPSNVEEWGANRFTVNRPFQLRDPSVLARGLLANMTGCRADVIICDDVEVPKTCCHSEKRETMRQKLSELDYILTPGGMIVYVGTPHTSETIYQTGSGGFLEHWQTLKIPILNEHGQSNWPDRFSLDKINALKKRSGPNKFLSQMMLKPVSITACRLDESRLKFYQGNLNYREVNGQAVLTLNGQRMVGVSCWWDPSFGSINGDKSVVACTFFDELGNAYLHHMGYLIVPKNEEATSYQCQKVCQIIRQFFVPAVHLETNGIGKFLPALLRQKLAQEHISCSVIEETSCRQKAERILSAFDPILMNGSLWVNETIKQTAFLSEMQDFIPNGKAHDDGLDAVAGTLLSEPVRLKRFPQSRITTNLEWRF